MNQTKKTAYTLRAATENDIDILTALSKAAFESDETVGATEAGGPPDYDNPQWHMQMATEGHLFAFTADGEPIGGAVLFKDGASLYVGRIFIAPSRFRQGLGLRLMTAVEQYYADVTAFLLDTPLWNVRTNAFYRKLGYTETRRDAEFAYYRKDCTAKKRYLNALFEAVTVRSDIPYDTTEKLCADIYLPKGDTERKRRTVVMIHGGGLTCCDKTQNYVVTLCTALAQCGYVCISPDYTLLPKGTITETRADVERVLPDFDALHQFLVAHADDYGMDIDHMAVCGGSAGGYLANELCKMGRYSALVSLWGVICYATSPEKYAPALLIHGNADARVPFEQSAQLYEALLTEKIPADFIKLEGAGHTAIERKDDFFPRILTFLDAHLSEA